MMTRLLKDESGMTMGLAVIMIALIGVMGAGLLTFVSRDLNAVVEVNQGQRAFEMADAGVKAARKQVRDVDPDPKHYGGSDGKAGDVQWAESKGGMDLSMDGNTANVKVKADAPSAGYFTVTSTGTASDARRKIEAVLYSSASFGGGGIPAYYTPGGMRIEKDGALNGLSFFAGGNVELRRGMSYGDGEDPLKDWNNLPYNTTPRKTPAGAPYTRTGIAAGGYVCNEDSCSGTGDSIADGVRFYDSTTGTKGNKKKFVEKDPPTLQPQDLNTISYPFSRVVNVDDLLGRARSGSPNLYLNPTSGNEIPGSTSRRVVFVEADNRTVTLAKNSPYSGVLVIRCGNLDMDKATTFTGIVILLKGEGTGCGSTANLNIKGGAALNGSVYAESNAGRAINVDKDAVIGPLPAGYEDLSRLAYTSSVEPVSWRELYQ